MSDKMRIRWFFALSAAILLIALSSCETLTFTKDYEFDLSFKVRSDSNSFISSDVIDALEYVTSVEEYSDKIESVEINSMTCYLSSFSGTDDQLLTDGVLTVSDEDETTTIVLALIPDDLLQNMIINEKTLELDDAGIKLAEDLIKNAPHRCKGILTGIDSSSPVSFTMTFHVSLTVTGKML